MKKHRLPFISDLMDYFRQPKPTLFKYGDRLRVYTDRPFFLGGASNTILTQVVSRGAILVYQHTIDNHYHFNVLIHEGHEVEGLKNNDRVFISTLTFDGIKYKEFNVNKTK